MVTENIDILIVSGVGGDWEWLYINNNLIYEHHHVDEILFTELVGKTVRRVRHAVWSNQMEAELSKGRESPQVVNDSMLKAIHTYFAPMIQ